MSTKKIEKPHVEFSLEKWYTTTQVVDLARQGYSPFKSLSTLYRLINEGKLKVVVSGDAKRKKFFIQGKDIVSFAEGQKTTISKPHDKPMQKGSAKVKR